MKTSFQQAGVALLCLAMASCSNSASTTSTTDSTATLGNTVVTTTTTTRRVYSGAFHPQDNMKYMDLKSHKQVSVRVDTNTGTLVNSETSEPMDLFVSGNDTIWGQNGATANSYITHDESGNYSVDQSRMSSGSTDMSNTPTTDNSAIGTGDMKATADAAAGSKVEKFKQKANGDTKIKTADEKIKDKNSVEKIKER